MEPDWEQFRIGDALEMSPGEARKRMEGFVNAFIDWRARAITPLLLLDEKPKKAPKKRSPKRQKREIQRQRT